jgi:hypothetical protein
VQCGRHVQDNANGLSVPIYIDGPEMGRPAGPAAVDGTIACLGERIVGVDGGGFYGSEYGTYCFPLFLAVTAIAPAKLDDGGLWRGAGSS